MYYREIINIEENKGPLLPFSMLHLSLAAFPDEFF
jgi:hypothetical protein